MSAMRFDIPDRRRPIRLGLVTALAVLVAVASESPAQVQPPPASMDTIRPVGGLRPGDIVAITVYPEDYLGGQFVVDDRGYVQTVAGMVLVAGLSPSATRDSVIQQFRKAGIVEPNITVNPLIRVHVLGSVGKPGVHLVPPGSNIIDLLSTAGGPTPDADLEHAHVVRGSQKHDVNLEAALAGVGGGRSVMFSNDVLVIPPENRFFRENLNTILSAVSAVLTIVTLALTIQDRQR